MEIGWYLTPQTGRKKEIPASFSAQLQQWIEMILPLVSSDHRHLAFAAMWALVWLSRASRWNPSSRLHVFRDLLESWRRWAIPELRFVAAWALASLPLVDRNSGLLEDQSGEVAEFITSCLALPPGNSYQEQMWADMERRAAVVISFYLRKPWSDQQLIEKIAEHVFSPENDLAAQMLSTFGSAGLEKLAEVTRSSQETTLFPDNP
jgi:hypothetical protein